MRYVVKSVYNSVTSILHDTADDAYQLQACTLERKFQSNVEDAVLQFTMLPTHPNRNVLHLLTATVTVEENGVEIFYGRIINIDTDKYGTQKATCEGAMKFFVDIPDIFSSRTDGETKYYCGDNTQDDDRYWMMEFWDRGLTYDDGNAEVPLYEWWEDGIINGDIFVHTIDDKINAYWQNLGFKLTDAGQIFTVRIRNAAVNHEIAKMYSDYLDELESIVAEGGIVTAENTDRANALLALLSPYFGENVVVESGIIPDYDAKKREAESYITHDMVYTPVSYEIPLVRYDIDLRGEGYRPISLLYFGNINLAYGPEDHAPETPDGKGFSKGWIKDRLYIEKSWYTDTDIPQETDTIPDTIPIPPASETNGYDFSEMDFCIVHRYDPDLWEGVNAGPVAYHGADVTWMWTTEKPESIASEFGRIGFVIKKDNKTTVQNMVGSVLSSVTDGVPDNSFGYNKYALPDRRIYLGSITANGAMDNTEVTTVYDHVKKWAETTGTYARLRKDTDGYYKLDLISRDGETSDDYYVSLGDNILDYSKTININNFATAIFPKGIYKYDSKEVEVQLLNNVAGILPTAGYAVDAERGIIYHEASYNAYGLIVVYRSYDLRGMSKGENQVMWRQYIYNRAVADLSNMQTGSVTMDIAAIDPRLLHVTGNAPVLGNKYPVDIPLFGATQYIQLTKILTDIVTPSKSKLTFGDNRTLLSDLTARRA